MTSEFYQFTSFKCLQKLAKCDPTGVKMAIFLKKSQKSSPDPYCDMLDLHQFACRAT